MKTIPKIPLSMFDYNKESKRMSIASEAFGMPAEFFVESHHTGRVVKFVPLPPWHKDFDADQWDGEMQVYMPDPGGVDGLDARTNVKTATIYHAW